MEDCMSTPSRGPVIEGVHQTTPDMVNVKEHFFDAFEHRETEVSARWITRFLIQRNPREWCAFTLKELEAFYHKDHKESFNFNRLIDPGWAFSIVNGHYQTGGGWIVLGDDNKYRVTQDFINRLPKIGAAS